MNEHQAFLIYSENEKSEAGLWLWLNMVKAPFCRLPMTDEQGHSMQGAIVTTSSQVSIRAVLSPWHSCNVLRFH